MRFASLGSGSQGNGTLIQTPNTVLMVDCGFPRKEAEARMLALGVDPGQLDALLVTHEHSDHCAGITALSNAHNIPVYLSHGTARHKKLAGCARQVRFNAGEEFSVGDIQVTSVPVPHDAREPVQYRLATPDTVLGILTDLGSITPHVVAAFSGCHALLLEFNHDRKLLQAGPYPATLKQRVGGDYGHLNNEQASELLAQIDTSKLRILVAGHLSQQNNTAEHTRAALDSVRDLHQAAVFMASQDLGFDWLCPSEPFDVSGFAAVAT